MDTQDLARMILGESGEAVEFWNGTEWVDEMPHDHDLDAWSLTPCVLMEHVSGDSMIVRKKP